MIHPDLLPLLEKHNITPNDFARRGRLPKEVSEFIVKARKAIVTELHERGTSWADMLAITGLSQGGIQRLTDAMWNPASRFTVRRVGKNVGTSWKGKKRPGQLERQWESGVFDFFKGRKLTDAQKQHLRESWTEDHRQRAGVHSKNLWSDTAVRDRLLSFHRSTEQRQKRSESQTLRMRANPEKYARGKSQWVDTPKGTTGRVFVRSSYEVKAVAKLEADATVLLYEYERRICLPNGKWMLPDFIALREGGIVTLVEVKSAWVLGLPGDSKEQNRLRVARDYSASQGWSFEVWTEKDLEC